MREYVVSISISGTPCEQKQFRMHTFIEAARNTFFLEKGETKCAFFCHIFLFSPPGAPPPSPRRRCRRAARRPFGRCRSPERPEIMKTHAFFPKKTFLKLLFKKQENLQNCTWATPATKITAIADLILAKSPNRDWRRFNMRGGGKVNITSGFLISLILLRRDHFRLSLNSGMRGESRVLDTQEQVEGRQG